MRLVWLILLCIIAYAVSVVVLFPASSVVARIEPQLAPLALSNVQGKLYKGSIGLVENKDDLLPLEFQNVSWRLAPSAIVSGGGAIIEFDGYGGGGKGLVKRGWNGDVSVSDMTFNAKAPEFDSITMPFASLAGEVSGTVEALELKNQLLAKFMGQLLWENAELTLPVKLALGKVEVDIKPEAENQHIANIKARGGEVSVDGKVTLTLQGDFNADVLLTPTNSASPDLANTLGQFARRDAQGRYRWVQRGNMNSL